MKKMKKSLIKVPTLLLGLKEILGKGTLTGGNEEEGLSNEEWLKLYGGK